MRKITDFCIDGAINMHGSLFQLSVILVRL